MYNKAVNFYGFLIITLTTNVPITAGVTDVENLRRLGPSVARCLLQRNGSYSFTEPPQRCAQPSGSYGSGCHLIAANE